MRSVLAQLSVIVSVSLLLTACPSNEGAKAVSEPEGFFAGPLPQGLPVFLEINEPYWAHDPSDIEDENSLSLYSMTLPEEGESASAPVSIFSVSSDQVTSLNTVADVNDLARADISILVNEGNVYKVDHQKGTSKSGSIRLINHFVNKVCEVIPVDVVQTTAVGNDVTHTVLHSDEIIYVVTVDGAVTEQDCSDPTKFKRFYELPLNFQFNADDDDASAINVLKAPVSESLARGQLVFGWVDDEVTALDGDQRLTYGYLGYSIIQKELSFYDEEREERWCQPRDLQTFDVKELALGKYSPEYLFQLTRLEQQQYQLQMGRDVFVFDSTSEIFSKADNLSYCETGGVSDINLSSNIEIESILTDRIFQTSIKMFDSSSEIINPVKTLTDDDEVVIVDDSRIFRYNYLDSYVAPVQTRNFNIEQHATVSIDDVASQGSEYPFSQFDLKPCSLYLDASACNVAHDVEANDWQFITECDADKGCSLPLNMSEFCATADELVADPNAGVLCTVRDYLHLDELNNTSNDAEFRGYMQYDRDFINSLAYTLHENSLFITARMTEKEVLLRYFYNVDANAAKADREMVLFGERINHFGFDVYINENNLFATVLWEAQRRENECYKDYQKVDCDLGNLDKGGINECSTFDLDNRDCFNSFQEYDSAALFCSASEISDGSCNDDSIIASSGIVVNDNDDNAKWLRMLDVGDVNSDTHVMYLLTDDKNTVNIDEDNKGTEGALINPVLFAVDNSVGQIDADNVLGQLNGEVEAVRSGWISNENLARFDVIAEEVEQLDKIVTDVNSVSHLYMVTDPNILSSGVEGINKQVINVGEVKSPRLVTQIDAMEE